MKEAGRVVNLVFATLKPMLVNGVNTLDLDLMAEKIIRDNGCTPPCKGYYGYPGSICISVNDTLIHGIPSKKIILREGDIVSLDVVASYKGYCADATRTYAVGVTTERAKRLMEVTKQSFFEALKLIKEGIHLGDISHRIQEINESNGYSIARDYTGHGIGAHMHEDPSIPNYGLAGTGPVLKAGMALAIEPMVLEGKAATRVLGDGWTVKSKDGKLTCHYENTVIVTKEGFEVITMNEEEKKEIYV